MFRKSPLPEQKYFDIIKTNKNIEDNIKILNEIDDSLIISDDNKLSIDTMLKEFVKTRIREFIEKTNLSGEKGILYKIMKLYHINQQDDVDYSDEVSEAVGREEYDEVLHSPGFIDTLATLNKSQAQSAKQACDALLFNLKLCLTELHHLQAQCHNKLEATLYKSLCHRG